MPVSLENFNKNLYDLLHTQGYKPVSLDSKGKVATVPNEADVFKISLDDDTKNAYVTIDDAQQLKIYVNDEELNEDSDTSSLNILTRHLKKWAQRRQLGFEIVNRDHLQPDMAMREHMKQKKRLGEGYYPMGKKASYSDNVPQVKIILQHTRQIEEGEQRFRNIAKIFVENVNGERFLVPTIRPGVARVFARHVAEGGTPYDERGKHITTLVEEYTKMAGFVRATRNGQFNESAQKLVNEGINHYHNLRETLSRMTGHRGYNNYFESWTPVLNEQTDEVNNLNELFVQETLDPRIESVMPILNRLSKNITEMSAVKELEEWAHSLTEVEDETTKTLAEPADEMLEEVDTGEYDARKTTPSSKEKQEKVFAKHRERMKNLDEAPGAETLAHNDKTEKSNLKAFDLDEEVTIKYEVVDKNGKRVGTWDGMVFKAYDRSKFPAGTMDKIPMGAKVDKESGPLDDKHVAMSKVGLEEESLDEINLGKAGKALAATAGLAAAGIGGEHMAKMPNLDQLQNQPNFAYELTQNLAKDPKYRESMEAYYDALNDPETSPMRKKLANQYNSDQYFRVWMDTIDQAKAKQPTMWNKIKNFVKSAFGEGVEEGLDANQKRVGQLGPTEPVGKNEKNLRGKLVGASESVELDRIKSLSGIK